MVLKNRLVFDVWSSKSTILTWNMREIKFKTQFTLHCPIWACIVAKWAFWLSNRRNWFFHHHVALKLKEILNHFHFSYNHKIQHCCSIVFKFYQFTLICLQLILKVNDLYSGYPRSKLACKWRHFCWFPSYSIPRREMYWIMWMIYQLTLRCKEKWNQNWKLFSLRY